MRLFRRRKKVPRADALQSEEPHVRKPRRFRVPVAVKPSKLLVAFVLIGIGAFGLSVNLGYVEAWYLRYWPTMIVVWGLAMAMVGGVWMWRGVKASNAEGLLLGGLIMAGLGVALLVDALGYAHWRDVAAGAITVAFGLGMILRAALSVRMSDDVPQAK